MNSDKALGPDGSMAFSQACWDVIKTKLWGCSIIFMLVVSLEKVLMPL
jgi:hypothetical protein